VRQRLADTIAAVMLRVLLAGLLLCLLAGTPGLGLETRTGGSALVGVLYGIPFLAAIAALVSTWRWRRAVRWLAWIAAGSAILLSALDLTGVMDPERPPTAVAVVEIGAIVFAVTIIIRMRGSVAARV
jgi:hypothetical protein